MFARTPSSRQCRANRHYGERTGMWNSGLRGMICALGLLWLASVCMAGGVMAGEPGLAWAAKLGASGQCAPALTPDETCALVGTDDGYVRWVRLADGGMAPPQLAALARTPFRAVLVGADGAVFAANADGRLYARTAKGETWHVPAGAPWGPLLAAPFFITLDGKEYVAAPSLDGHIYLVHPATKTSRVWLTAGGGIEAAPTLGTPVAPAVTTLAEAMPTRQAWVVVTDPTHCFPGDELLLAGKPAGYITAVDLAARRVAFDGSPATALKAGVNVATLPHRPLYFGANNGRVYAMNADTLAPRLRWVFPGAAMRVEGFSASPLLVGTRLYLGNRGGTLFTFDAGCGTLCGTPQRFAGACATPVQARPTVLVVGLASGGVVRVDLTPPDAPEMKLFREDIPAPVTAPPAADAEGRLLCPGANGSLFCVRLTPEGDLQSVWQWPPQPVAPFRTAPVLTRDGRALAVAQDGTLYCLASDGTAAVPPCGAIPAGGWPQFQREAGHDGQVGEPVTVPPAPASLISDAFAVSKLRWALPTGGSAPTAVSVTLSSDVMRSVKLRAPVPAGATVIPVADAGVFYLGDPLVLGEDYLGPITVLQRDPPAVTVRYAAAHAHDPADHDEVQTSLYRRGQVRGGDVQPLGRVVSAVPAESGLGALWYAGDRRFDVKAGTVSLSARLAPHFTATDQYVWFGLMTDDPAVLNPSRPQSPVYLYLQLTAAGEVSLHRRIGGDGPHVAVDPHRDVDVLLVVTPRDATAYCRQGDAAYQRLGDLPLPTGEKGDRALPASVYPFFRGYDAADKHAFFSAAAEGVTAQVGASPLDAVVLGPGAHSFTVNHPEQFLPGDLVQITHPARGDYEYLPVTRIEGDRLYLDPDFTLQRTYPAGSNLWVGQPGRWVAFAASDDGALRAVDPDTGQLLWRTTADAYLGAARGALAVDRRLCRVYVAGAGGRLFAFAQSGLFLWAYPPLQGGAPAPIAAPPVLDDQGNIFLATLEGRVVKITPDGVATGEYPAAGDPPAGPLVGLALYQVNGAVRLAAAARNGKLYVLDEELQPLTVYPDQAPTRPAVGRLLAGPVVGVGGIIYLGDERGVVQAIEEHNGRFVNCWTRVTGAPVVGLAAVRGGIYAAGRDGTVTALVGDEPKTLTFVLGEPISSPPALDAGGNLLLGTAQGSLVCLAAFTAWPDALRWRWNARDDARMPAALPLRAAPALWLGNAVLVGGDDGNLYAVGPRGAGGDAVPTPDRRCPQPAAEPREPGPNSPTLRWAVPGGSTAPAVTDRTPTGHLRVYQGDAQGRLTARNAVTGETLWQVPLPDAGPVRAVAVAADGAVVVTAEYSLSRVAPDGAVRWSHKQEYGGESLVTEKTVFAASLDKVSALNIADGIPRWQSEQALVTGLAWREDTLFLCAGDGKVTALSSADGAVRWTRDTGKRVTAPPVLCAVGVLVVAAEGAITVFDARTGEPLAPVGSVLGPCSQAPVLSAEDNGFLVTDFGRLYRLNLRTAESPALLLELPSEVHAPPVLDSRGLLYLPADNGELYCVDSLTGQLRWQYRPDRGAPTSALAADVLAGSVTLPVTSTVGFRPGDSVLVVRPDGSLPEPLGQVTAVTQAEEDGFTAGTLTLSRAPSTARGCGDLLRVLRGSAAPFCTAPVLGPGEMLYVSAADGTLLALGPPAAHPVLLPPIIDRDMIPPVATDGFGYGAIRWQRELYVQPGPPALGGADSLAPEGLVYVGLPHALAAYDAATGRMRWRSPAPGGIDAAPAVLRIQAARAGEPGDELVICGTADLPASAPAPLLAAAILDAEGRERETGAMLPAGALLLAVKTRGTFAPGSALFLTQYEPLGTVATVTQAGDAVWLRLVAPHRLRAEYIPAAQLLAGTAQQGHLIAVDRAGRLRWQFPLAGGEATATFHVSPAVSTSSVTAESENFARARIYAVSTDGVVYALDADGREAWRYAVEGAARACTAPVLNSGASRLYIGVDTDLLALRTETDDDADRLRWRTHLPGPITAGLLLAGNLYITVTVDGHNAQYMLDPVSGQILGTTPAPPTPGLPFRTTPDAILVSYAPGPKPATFQDIHMQLAERIALEARQYIEAVAEDKWKFTLTLHNPVDVPLEHVSVTDLLPDGLRAEADHAVVRGREIRWSLPTLPVGGLTLTFTADMPKVPEAEARLEVGTAHKLGETLILQFTHPTPTMGENVVLVSLDGNPGAKFPDEVTRSAVPVQAWAPLFRLTLTKDAEEPTRLSMTFHPGAPDALGREMRLHTAEDPAATQATTTFRLPLLPQAFPAARLWEGDARYRGLAPGAWRLELQQARTRLGGNVQWGAPATAELRITDSLEVSPDGITNRASISLPLAMTPAELRLAGDPQSFTDSDPFREHYLTAPLASPRRTAPGETWHLPTGVLIPQYQPAGTYRASGAQTFLDFNGNGVQDPGEPAMALPLPDVSVPPTGAVMARETAVDLGRAAVAGGSPDTPAALSLLYTGNADTASVSAQWLADIAGVPRFFLDQVGAPASTLALRLPFLNDWRLLKNPAGTESPRVAQRTLTPFAMPARQPSGIYTGSLLLRTLQAGQGAELRVPVMLRVGDTRLSQVIPGLTEPPAFDASRIAPPIMHNTGWTNYLTGAEWDPCALALPGAATDDLEARDDLGVWVASNTPVAPDDFNRAVPDFTRLLPVPGTDSNIWFRRVRTLSTLLLADGTDGATTLTVPPSVARQARAQTNATADLIVLRTAGQPDWYGQLTAVDAAAGILIVQPAVSGNRPAAATRVEILGHPWVPMLSPANLQALARKMGDPGDAAAGTPHPIRCSAPAVCMDRRRGIWLMWTVSAVRRFTINGRVNYLPASYLAYKPFNPDNPPANDIQWVEEPGPEPDARIAQRERPVFLPHVAGLLGVVLYESGQLGLQYAYLPDGQPELRWRVDQSLSVLNWALQEVSCPQAWADTVQGEAETPLHSLNLLVQGHAEGGQSGLYYARLRVDPTRPQPLVAQPLTLPGADAAGKVSETLTARDGNTRFTGGAYLAWADLTVVVNDEQELPTDINDLQPEYTLRTPDGHIRLSVDPYRGLVRVVTGTVHSIRFVGRPRLQRLTAHLMSDQQPAIAVERWRGWDGAVRLDDPELLARPRVWLFWTRRHDGGLGRRIWYRPWRMVNAGTSAAPIITGLTPEAQEQMLPTDELTQDSGLAVLPQCAGPHSPETGVWVLTTSARDLWPPYPLTPPRDPAPQDLFMQVFTPR